MEQNAKYVHVPLRYSAGKQIAPRERSERIYALRVPV